MVCIQLILVLFFVLLTTCFDPDEDICNNPTIDSSVNAFDGNTYIFKGQYYWRTNPLDVSSGIVGYADLISNKWPEVKDPIVGSFTLHKPRLVTVLVTDKNDWFAYEMGSKPVSGSTANWPEFERSSIDTMFSMDSNNKSEVFVIYNNSHKYLVYDFSQPAAPRIQRKGRTKTEKFDNGRLVIWFIDNRLDEELKTDLSDILPVMSAIKYDTTLIFLAKNQMYCRIDLTKGYFTKECEPVLSIRLLFNCPLDLNKRPTTTTLKTETTDSNTDVITQTSVNQSVDPNTSVDQSSTSSNTISSEQTINTVMSTESDSDESSWMTIEYILIVIAIVIIVVIFVVIIAFIIIKPKNNPKTRALKRNMSDQSMCSVVTINSNTGVGETASSPSIISLKETATRISS